jgi:site-specific DNA-methyltransferase (cytosine-N4-specific)
MTDTPHPDRHEDQRLNQVQDRGGLAGYRYRQAGPVSLYLGDAREVLAAMPDASVDIVVTSPPFWGLRDYGTGRWDGGDPACPHHALQPGGNRGRDGDGGRCPCCAAVWTDPQYGLEPTVDRYVARLVAVFDEVRRVLAPTGTAWLNLGDSYSSAAGGAPASGRPQRNGIRPVRPRAQDQLPPKNLIGVPWRAAFALQRSGWILRNAVVWAKTNPMPESVRDRLSTTYEMVFLLTRSSRYVFDLDPIRVPLKYPDAADGSRVFGGTNKAGHGGIDATARRRGARYGTPPDSGAGPQPGKYTAGTGVEPRAGRGNLRPVGHAHTAAHPHGRKGPPGARSNWFVEPGGQRFFELGRPLTCLMSPTPGTAQAK